MENEIINDAVSVEEGAKMISVSKNRVAFKIHLAVFLVLNLIIWVLWFTAISALVTDANVSTFVLKLSLCITLVWLLLVILHYCIAYRWNQTLVEKELARIRKQRDKQLKEIEKIKAKIAETKNQQQPTE